MNGDRFPTPFGGVQDGVFLPSSPLVNALWAVANMALAVYAYRVGSRRISRLTIDIMTILGAAVLIVLLSANADTLWMHYVPRT